MENVITNVHNEKTKYIDLGHKVKETNKDVQIQERIGINLNSYLLLKEILTQMKLAHEVGDLQCLMINGIDGLLYCIANWHI